MSWQEFAHLVSGLNSDTPLGQIVAIRAEKDPKKLKNFTSEQKRIRNEWLKFLNSQKSESEKRAYWDNVQQTAKMAFQVVHRP